jgi:uncharacterized protein YjbI with pentapeptide repeats
VTDLREGRTTTSSRRLAWSILVGAVVVLVVSVLALWVVPDLWFRDRTFGSLARRAHAKAELRGNILQALAGVALVATGVFTWWRVRIEQHQADSAAGQADAAMEQARAAMSQAEAATTQAAVAQAQIEAIREDQATARLVKAIDDAFAAGDDGLGRRLSGIMALERLAQESLRRSKAAQDDQGTSDHDVVVEVLSELIRQHATDAKTPPPDGTETGWWSPNRDVEMALRVLGRLGLGARLRGLAVPGMNFLRLQLERADLAESDLRRTYFAEANLAGADLSRSNLGGSDLFDADLHGADLTNARLEGSTAFLANLSSASMCLADLGPHRAGAGKDAVSPADEERATDWTAVDLTAANLRGVDFTGIDLSDAKLVGADLRDITSDEVEEENARRVGREKLIGARETSFAGARVSRADFTGATFSD